MTYQQAINHIHSLHRFGRKPELRRMELLMQQLGDPQHELRFIHVAGTNGKGSTSVMLGSILRSAGYSVGVYTSPFIVDFRERIVLNDVMITKKELTALVEEVAKAAAEVEREYDAPREFEFITACALLYYQRKRCDFVVLEVGLGGRFDATNIIPPPLAAVICPIGLDHVEWLGDEIAGIAAEKCGIIKHGSEVICNPYQEAAALEVVQEQCRSQGCALTLPQPSQLVVEHSGLDGSSFIYHGERYSVALVGPHQVGNAITAIDAAFALGRHGIVLTPAQIAQGLQKAYIPGRMEVFAGEPVVILDGAHNPHGMYALRDSLFASGVSDITAVVGMLADKNCASALDIIAPFMRRIIVTQPDSPRALPAADLAEMAKYYCSGIVVEPDCGKAFALARATATKTVLVFGSLYLVSSVRKQLVE